MLTPIIKGAANDLQLSDLGALSYEKTLVLVATDGSEPAVRATQHAVVLAGLLGARLRAIHVNMGLEELALPEPPVSEAVYERLDPGIKGLVVAQRLAELNGVECALEVAKGGVARNIIGVALREGAGLIVLGDTGRTGLSRLALGSVAEAVVKASAIPILVVKAR